MNLVVHVITGFYINYSVGFLHKVNHKDVEIFHNFKEKAIIKVISINRTIIKTMRYEMK